MATSSNPYGGGDGNPGGPGGRRSKIQTNVPRGQTSHKAGGGQPPKKKCCPTGMAVDAVRRGKFRLAARYARLAARLIVARVA